MVFKSFLSKAKDIDILSSIPDGVMLIENTGKIEWINELIPNLFKMERAEVLKHDVNEIIESGLELIRQAQESKRSVVGRIKAEAEEVYLEITATSSENYYVVSLRDVTQNYRTVTNIISEHESSQKVNKDKNNFLVKLANEIKSPIHSVVGFSQAMIDGLGGEMSDKQEKYVKIINKNSSDVLYLFNKIIELAKTESNLMEYDFQTFDSVNVIQGVVKELEPKIKSKKLDFVFETSELQKKTIFSDEEGLKIIVRNILEVSLGLTDIGSIAVKVEHPALELMMAHNMAGLDEKSFIYITVADTGAGFAEGDLGVIFDPYAQLERPNKKNIVRSIGLASVKNIVKYLKGEIWIDSEPMQKTVYNVILPIEKA